MQNNVAGYRKMFRITQAELAEKVQMQTPNLSLKENGKVEFKQSEMVGILNVFREFRPSLTLDDIFLG